MIIVNENTEKRLTQKLELLQTNASTARSVYFHFSKTDITESRFLPILTDYLHTNLRADDSLQLFICADGDVCIIGSIITERDIALFIDYLNCNLEENISDIAHSYKLPKQLSPLRVNIDEKIKLEKEKQQVEADAIEKSKQKKRRHFILNLPNEEQAKASIVTTRNNQSEPTIMVVEDDAFTRQLVINTLKKQYTVEATGAPAEVLSLYVKNAPTILFLDINLPDVSGHELLECILALDPNACIIMLSANADKDNITSAMNKGAKGFVGKPFTKDKLFQYIDKYLTHKE